MEEIIFYHNPRSRGVMAHWMLEEVGAPYRIVVLDFEKNEHKTPEYLMINPMGKVPAIVDRGTVITETGAICAYLADAFPEAGLAPAIGDPARGTWYRWLFFGAGCVEPALVDRMFTRPPVERKGALGYGSYEDTVDALEEALRPGPFILGDRFSAADVYVGSEIVWGMTTGSLEKRSIFEAYTARLAERPAFKRVFVENS